MTFTGTQLVSKALTLVGAIATGEAPSAAEAQDALLILNGLLDTFANQRLAMPASGRDVFTTVDNQSTYTVGPGADFNITPKPIRIDYASVLSLNASPSFEIPMQALDEQSYAGITIKDETSTFPSNYFYNATQGVNGSLFLWQTPTQSATYQIVLYTPTQLAQFPSLNTTVTMNAGYYRMLYYNLAVELAPAFYKALDPQIVRLAVSSLADIKRTNLQMIDLDTSSSLPGTSGIYSIYSDQNY